MSKRSWGACLAQLCGAAGQCLLAGVVFLVRDWRLAQIITAALHAVVALYVWFLPESARWLLGRGRIEEAKQLISRVARINKCNAPGFLLEKIVGKEIEEKAGVITLFQSSVLRKYFLTLIFAWFSLNVTYFCLSLNVGKFGMDVFLTQFIFGLSEIPAHILCIWLLEALGRKVSIIATLVLGGLLCILILAVPPGVAVAVTVLATLGRFFTNWAASICGIYVQELFPTSFRQTASGLGSVASRAGGLIAPLLNMLEFYHKSIPTVAFSSITIISGALCFLLPETRRKELPDTLTEAEDYRKKIARKYQDETLESHQKCATKL